MKPWLLTGLAILAAVAVQAQDSTNPPPLRLAALTDAQ